MPSNGAHAGQPTINPQAGVRVAENPDLAFAARSDAGILLTGSARQAREFAYRLHLVSGWRHGAFTVIDCASTDPELEWRLFDAIFPKDYPPRASGVELRLVQAGTVLLQEINRLPLAIQRRLAGRLSAMWAPDGPYRSRRRLMASSSEPLLDRVLGGTFDDSLYYRLNVMHFFLPGDRRS